MSTTMNKVVGGSFIIEDTDFNQVVTPEDFTEEHRMIAQTTADFVEGEIDSPRRGNRKAQL
ncbi:hypothetical protein VQ056_14530 [Paenibacillus sp. JTLBN-2024]